jgi:hypothetical protein
MSSSVMPYYDSSLAVSLSLCRDVGLVICHSWCVGFVVDRVTMGTWALICQYRPSVLHVHSFILVLLLLEQVVKAWKPSKTAVVLHQTSVLDAKPH